MYYVNNDVVKIINLESKIFYQVEKRELLKTNDSHSSVACLSFRDYCVAFAINVRLFITDAKYISRNHYYRQCLGETRMEYR